MADIWNERQSLLNRQYTIAVDDFDMSVTYVTRYYATPT